MIQNRKPQTAKLAPARSDKRRCALMKLLIVLIIVIAIIIVALIWGAVAIANIKAQHGMIDKISKNFENFNDDDDLDN